MPQSKEVTVLYFASVRTLLGISSETIRLQDDQKTLELSQLPALLFQQHPDKVEDLKRIFQTSRWSVDQTLVESEEMSDYQLKGGEEVAIIPPAEDETFPLKAEPLAKEPKTKPQPNPTERGEKSLYSASPCGVDSNLLIFFHGIGDTAQPFFKLGQNLQKTLPQTAILSLQASRKVPFLEDTEQGAWMWWDSFDPFGEMLTKPNPTQAIESISKLLSHLTGEVEKRGCGWPPNAIHLFGFGQGASVALESCLAWTKERRRAKQTETLASVVAICGGFVSHPTLNPPLSTTLLYLYRSRTTAPNSSSIMASLRKASPQLKTHRLDPIHHPSGEIITERMPSNQSEWDPIMQFWSPLFRHRSTWEWDENVVRVG